MINVKTVGLLIKCLVLGAFLHAQTMLEGVVLDKETKEGLIGASVEVSKEITVTNIEGKFQLMVNLGDTLKVNFIGYEPFQKVIDNTLINNKPYFIYLTPTSFGLSEVSVTANKFEQKVEDLTISVDVLKPEMLITNGATDIESAADQNPGVYMADGQANIRGGSGFSYGAGSRVMVLIDGLPILSADAGDVKWNALPMENIEQIEVIKGASSALYGSSALNGVINIQTGFAKDTSITSFRTYYGAYQNPKDLQAVWWSKKPMFYGAHLNHAQKVKNHDLVFGGAYFNDEGYRQGGNEDRYRLNWKWRWNTPVEGLKIGLDGSGMQTTGGQIIIWENDTSGLYLPRNGEVTKYVNKRLYIDPYLTYLSDGGASHSIKNRIYFTDNRNDSDQGSQARSMFHQYQFQKKFFSSLVTTGGLVYAKNDVKSELYSNHQSENMALFAQADWKYKRFNFSAGLRQEGFRMDEDPMEWKPNFRYGMNYQLAKVTFLRGSYGEGFRQPSIGEKFINTTIPGLFFIPNPELQSESGWSAEIGIKQGYKIGKWKGYVDVAGFVNRFENMIEFRQDSIIINDLFAGDILLGFQAMNVEDAIIKGVETTFMGGGKIGKIEVQLFGGYTFMNPIDLTIDISDTSFTSGDEILKYRFKHLFKTNLQLKYKALSFGIAYRYNSYVRNIDSIFEEQVLGIYVIPGVASYRAQKTTGDDIVDVNIGYSYKQHQLSLILKNALNERYTQRPADAQAPRTMMFQYRLNF